MKDIHIGFVTIWFERGQAYVTKTLRDLLAKRYKTFILARTSKLYGRPRLETEGFWNVPNLTTYSDYEIPHQVMVRWIKDNSLDLVIFNEEYDFSLVDLCKRRGLFTLTYLDFFKDDLRDYMKLYDAVLCSTKRTFNHVKDFCNAYYIGWGIDHQLFSPRDEEERYTFFHNAGWLGVNLRKMTPAVIIAFDAISRIDRDLSLLIHSQVGLELLPLEVRRIVEGNPRINFYVGTIPAPGLYHRGLIYVYPSKLDGLGLSLIEALSCGLPAITTDAPPMNEFVKDGYNGLLVRVAERRHRSDGIAFPEEIVDLNDLAVKMYLLSRDKELLYNMAQNARHFVLENLNWEKKEDLFQIIKGLF